MEWLANLSVKWVLVGVAALVLALTLSRLFTSERDQTGAWIIENLQVVLSVVVVVFLIIRPFLFQAFYIPSPSMEPTLLGPAAGGGTGGAGDRLLVNKLIYRVSEPRRGDIVVFNAPPAASPPEPDYPRGREYIKRVMGEPGETISVAPPRITVDGQQAVSLTQRGSYNTGPTVPGLSVGLEEPQIDPSGKSAEIPNYSERPIRVVAAPQLEVRYTPYRVELNGKVLLESVEGRIEEIDGISRFGANSKVQGRAFRIQTDDGNEDDPGIILLKGKRLDYRPSQVMINGKAVPDFTPRPGDYGMAPVKLKPGEYFMLGDNRPNSNDSHAWGPLTRDRIIGRAEIIFWPVNRFKILDWWLVIALGVLFVAYELLTRLLRSRYQAGPPMREVSPSPVGAPRR